MTERLNVMRFATTQRLCRQRSFLNACAAGLGIALYAVGVHIGNQPFLWLYRRQKEALSPRNSLTTDLGLCINSFVLRNQTLHDEPCDEISHAAEAEHNEVTGWFAFKAKELEHAALFFSVCEKVSGSFLDNH